MKERPGFKQFVSHNKEALKALAAMRDELQVIGHLAAHAVSPIRVHATCACDVAFPLGLAHALLIDTHSFGP